MTIADPVWQSRLRVVLGVPLSALDYEHVARLVELETQEAADLDFKRTLYGADNGSKQELCKDIAALCNAGGGLLILGIRDEDGIAVESPGVALSDQEKSRMLQILASGVAPFLECEIEPLPGRDSTHGFYALIAGPSQAQPHAVTHNDWLRYPRRNGTVTRWLSEVEVADAYRSRFRGETDQRDRLERIGDEAKAQMRQDRPWLLVSVIPNRSGALPMSFAERRAIEEWAHTNFTSRDYAEGLFEQPGIPMAGVGVERYTLKSQLDQEGLATYAYAECHADGAGVAARQLNSQNGDDTVMDFSLVHTATKCLRFLGGHALRTGASGDAVVHVWVSGTEMRLGYFTSGAVQHYRPGLTLREGHSRHTIPLSAIAEIGADLYIAVRLAVMDVFNAFARAETPHINENGALRLRYFDDAELARWAREHNLETTDERVQE